MSFDANKILQALQTDPSQVLDHLKTGGADLMDKLKTDPTTQKIAMGVGAGVLGGMLAGRAAPRLTGNVLTLGALAALGGLAYKAYKAHEAKQAGTAVPDVADDDVDAARAEGFLADAETNPDFGKALVRAMIASAKADGHVDSDEKGRIFDRLMQISLSEDEMEFVTREIARPLNIDEVAAGATTPQQAAALYSASLMAINPDRAAERAYLNDLAAKLGLSEALVAEIHSQVA
jgi:uncharacterized membrane protein YebE (DUF533 family)